MISNFFSNLKDSLIICAGRWWWCTEHCTSSWHANVSLKKVPQPHLHLSKGICWVEETQKWIGGSRHGAASPEEGEGWVICSSQVNSRNQGSWTKGLKTRHWVTAPEESLLPAEEFNSSMKGSAQCLAQGPTFHRGDVKADYFLLNKMSFWQVLCCRGLYSDLLWSVVLPKLQFS